MENERKAEFDQQTAELYEAVGKFAVRFEHMCQALRSGITFMLQRHGLANQNVATLLLADLTAFPLQNIFSSVLAETVELTDDGRRIINNIMKRCQKLTEERNDVIHNAWYIGWASPQQTDFHETTAMKPHRDKKGGEFKVFKRTAEDFLKLVDLADELTALVNRAWGCVATNSRIENNFEIDPEGNARLTESLA